MKERRQRPRAAPEASCGLVPVAPQHGQPICGGGGAHLHLQLLLLLQLQQARTIIEFEFILDWTRSC